jgi:hypothetical protein
MSFLEKEIELAKTEMKMWAALATAAIFLMAAIWLLS